MVNGLQPYPEYKATGVHWLGDIPSHWSSAMIRRYCRVFAGATPSRAIPEYWQGGTLPWLSSGDVNLRRIARASQFITEAGFAASSTKWIRPKSLVIALAGQGRTKGMVATIEFATTCNQSLGAVEPDEDIADYRYVAYFLESKYREIRSLVGDGLRDGLNLEIVKALFTPLPPLDEQVAIVRFLDHADALIRNYIRSKRREIALLNEQKQAIIQQAVTKGLDPNVPMKDSGVEWLGEIPAHWAVQKLKRLTWKIVDGTHFTPTYTDSGAAFLRVTDIHGSVIDFSKVKRIPWSEHEMLSKRCRPEKGDILLSKNGTIGLPRVVDWEEPFSIFVSLCLIKPKSALYPWFAYYFFFSRAIREQMNEGGKQNTVTNLHLDKIREFYFSVPPHNEQVQICDYLRKHTSDFDRAIGMLRDQIGTLREYRISLIADVVTGKLDVRQAALRLPDIVEDVPAEELEPDEADLNVEDAMNDEEEVDDAE